VTAVDTAALRCTDQAREMAVDPAGTAGHARAVLLVEVPLPWPKDIADHPALATSVSPLAAELGARLQGLVPDPARAAAGEALVVLHRAGPGAFRRYERHAAVVPAADLAAGVRAVAASTTPAPATEVLVCGHGARDRCCGSLGTALHSGLGAGGDAGRLTHRTSHLGGHRFAPTALLLPEATVWAWLDGPLLGAILDRRVPPAALRDHYRGSLAMPQGAAQVVEGAVFAAVGWDWLDHARTAAVSDGDGGGDARGNGGPDRWTVRIDSTAGTWHGVVERTGTAPQPVCGQPLSAATKADDMLRLLSLEEAR
jgi:hypothetical protein